MEAWTLVAILGPWTAGTVICRQRGNSGLAAFVRGWFVGQALVMFGSPVLLNSLGIGAFRWAALIMLASGLLIVKAIVREIGEELNARIKARKRNETDSVHASSAMGGNELAHLNWSVAEIIALGAFLLMFISKVKPGLMAVALIPARCEDALAYWLFKAKIITLLGHIPLNPSDPFYLGGSNPNYPLFPSMIAAWIPLVMGQWSESFSVIPWLLTFINLPLVAATSLPRETTRLTRIVVAYVVSSLPLAAIHVFRPGYVDLILAGFLLCGVGLMLVWRAEPRTSTLAVATILFIAAACTKREGVVAVAAVLGVFITFTVVDQIRRTKPSKSPLALLIMGVSTGVAIWFLMDLSDVSSDASHWSYHPEAWAALWRHAFEWSSFSLFFPFAFAIAAGLLISRRGTNVYLATALCIALCAYAISPFLLTDNVRFALNDQTPSRLLLHVAPAMAIALANGVNRRSACLAPMN